MKFEIYKDQLIELTPIRELFTERDINKISQIVTKDHCHINSFILANILQDVEYCEGFYNDGTTISHCFNRYKDKYFDFSTALYYPHIKNVYLKRVINAKDITDIFIKESKCFITFMGYVTKDHIIRYNDNAEREISYNCIVNGKEIGALLILQERLKSLIGKKPDKDNIAQFLQQIKDILSLVGKIQVLDKK